MAMSKGKAALIVLGGLAAAGAIGKGVLSVTGGVGNIYGALQTRDIKGTNRRILNNSRRTNELLNELVSRGKDTSRTPRYIKQKIKREPLG